MAQHPFGGWQSGRCLSVRSFLFWNRFTPGTTVNDRSVALLSPKEAALNQIRDTSQTMLIFLRRGGSTESFTYRELGVFCPSDAEIATLSVSGWTWPVRLFVKTAYTFDRTLDYDYEMLSQVLLSSDSVTSPYLVEPSDVSRPVRQTGRFPGACAGRKCAEYGTVAACGV